MNKNGFSHILVLVSILVVGVIGASGFYVWDRTNKANLENEQNSAAELEGLESDVTEQEVAGEIEEKQEETKPEEVKEEPAPIVKEEPKVVTPEPAPVVKEEPKPNITPLSISDCTGSFFTAYVSNTNGTSGSYQPPNNWKTVQSYGYRESISVFCQKDATYTPNYVIGNDQYIKAADLSKTKP